MIILKDIEAKLAELKLLIAVFKEQSATVTLRLPEVSIELQPGEHYAGAVLDESGHLMHHLVLLAQRPTGKLNWQAATEWAASIGGGLPDRQEFSLLFANCKPHLQPVWHWSREADASFAWGYDFNLGDIISNRKRYEGSAVAVRRVYPGETK